ncbi:molybdopterin-dependent oxidoreductase [Chloroflexota bacterium]
MTKSTLNKDEVKEDVWIKTSCNICFSNCAIRVHRVDGRVVKTEGNPDCPTSLGGICPRGASGLMLLYDPNRVNVPLKRTNPEKGIGVDPKWMEITWDEALDTITEKLKKIKAEDPRKLLGGGTVILNTSPLTVHSSFFDAFGSINGSVGGITHCGGASHMVSGLMHSSWTRSPDPNYIEYYLNFGCPSGFGAYYSVSGMAQRMADARRRGMRHVAIEPWMGMPGINSDEWIPIRPGTDAAMALAMVNLLLNEYGIYDVDRITNFTNGPYLVKADGHYLRDKETNKPLMWDISDSKAKTFDDPTVKDVSIDGSFSVDGVTVKPAFSLIKEHVKKYTPEMAAEITTIPASTIRRLSKEFGEAAKIGSTVLIDGVDLPYRPVAVGYFKGAIAHKHSALTALALDILQEVVGASNVPGGCLGMSSRSFGHPETGHPSYSPSTGPDGLLQVGHWKSGPPPWPAQAPKPPESIGLKEIVPTASSSPLVPWGISDAEKYKIPYKPEMMIRMGGNFIASTYNPEVWETALKDSNIFTVYFSLFLDESTEFADIVLPDTCYLERLDIQADWQSSLSPVDEWAYHLRQPVVEPMFQRKPAHEIYLELAERLDILPGMYAAINRSFHFQEPYTLDPQKKYTWEEIVDHGFKGNFGPEHGLEWFKENGLIHWPKKTEEVYWRPFINARTPIYFEHLLTVGEEVEKIKKECGILGFPTSDHQPIPDWKPCASHEEKRPEFDLYSTYYRIPFQTFSSTYNNPWLDEVSRMDPYVYNIAINTETAKKKSIKSGDLVILESAGTGSKVEGKVVLTEGVHPEVVAFCSGGGHWSKRLPIASQRGKGINPDWLFPLSWESVDSISLNLDTCTKVKLTKKV